MDTPGNTHYTVYSDSVTTLTKLVASAAPVQCMRSNKPSMANTRASHAHGCGVARFQTLPAALQLALHLYSFAALPKAAHAPRIYPDYNDVSAHPDVRGARYGTTHMDFASFGNRSRWATRGFHCNATEMGAQLDMMSEANAGLMGPGDLAAPHFASLDCPLEQFAPMMQEIKKRGLRVSGFWGMLPGSGVTNGVDGPRWSSPDRYGHKLELMDQIFGPDNWSGANIGEADGHYENYVNEMIHISNYGDGRREQYGNFQDEFEEEQLQLGGKITSLMADMTGAHYWAKSGLVTVVGGEVAQGLPSSQLMYSFLRGAAKEYGTLMIGNPSTCGRFGMKCYADDWLLLPAGGLAN